jgi:ABC-2 type transport system permease protein
VKTMILTALYAYAEGAQPISLAQALTYVWLGQATITLLPWDVDDEIEEMVRSGNMANALIHPIDIYGLFFARSVALRLFPTLVRGTIVVIIAAFFFGLAPPPSVGIAFAFAFSVFLAAALASAMTAIVSTTLFWTICGEGVQRIMPHFTLLLSGLVLPLPLFPDWLQPLLSVQPFRGIIDIPCRIYTGMIPLGGVFYAFLFQTVWLAVIVRSGRWLMTKALARVEIQGG